MESDSAELTGGPPEARVQTEAKSWKREPYIWFASRRVPVSARPPFNARNRSDGLLRLPLEGV